MFVFSRCLYMYYGQGWHVICVSNPPFWHVVNLTVQLYNLSIRVDPDLVILFYSEHLFRTHWTRIYACFIQEKTQFCGLIAWLSKLNGYNTRANTLNKQLKMSKPTATIQFNIQINSENSHFFPNFGSCAIFNAK